VQFENNIKTLFRFFCNNPIEASGGGITIQPENAEEIVMAIKKIIALSPEERKSMGEKALEFVKDNYDIKVLADKFEKGIIVKGEM